MPCSSTSPDRCSAPVTTRAIGSSALPKAAGPVIVASPSMKTSRFPASIAAPSRPAQSLAQSTRRAAGCAVHAAGPMPKMRAKKRSADSARRAASLAGERSAERSARRRADAKRGGGDAAARVDCERAACAIDVVDTERGSAGVDVAVRPSAPPRAARAAPAASPRRPPDARSLRRPRRCSRRRSRPDRCACSRSQRCERRRAGSPRRARRRRPARGRCRSGAGSAGRPPAGQWQVQPSAPRKHATCNGNGRAAVHPGARREITGWNIDPNHALAKRRPPRRPRSAGNRRRSATDR